MKKLLIGLALTGTVALLPTAWAADNEQPAIIVTATRTAQTADQSLASVTVITRKDIENSKAVSVPELLRGIAGFDVTNQGGLGKLTSVFLRGTNSNQVLVLVDGLKWGSVSSGTISWEFLPVSEIERIEIVRGPRSSLYGSEAVGGVIQIFTRTGQGPPRAHVEVGAGTQDTRTVAAGISANNQHDWYNVSASSLSTAGINARQPTVEFGIPLNEPDNDGFNNNAASVRYGHRFAHAGNIEFFVLQTQGNTEYDAIGANEDNFSDQVAGLKYRYQVLPRWGLSLEGGRTEDNRTSFRADGSVPNTRFDSSIQTLSWQNDLTFGTEHVLTLGADYRNESIDSTIDFSQTSRTDTGLFGQYQGSLHGQDLLLGLRRDNNEQFGDQTTGNVAWGHTLASGPRLFASFGTAFKAPTFNDLFFPEFGGIPTANPNLQPERSQSLELGARGQARTNRWDVRAYHTHIKDLIQLDENFIPQNIDSATINGLEAEFWSTLAGWASHVALSLVDPRDDATGNVLPRRAEQTLRVDVSRGFHKTQLQLTLIAQGPRYDDPDNQIELAGYGIVNVTVNYQLAKNWTLGAVINNIFDQHYQTVSTFNQLGLNALFTIAYHAQLQHNVRDNGSSVQ